MAYSLQFHPDRVVRHIREHRLLNRAGRLAIYHQLHDDLAVNGDHYRVDLTRRLAPGSPYFFFHAVTVDAEDRPRLFRFVVNDEPAPYGVLQVEYVDDREW